MYRATGDSAIRDKAVRLMGEWRKTVKPDGDCGMRHYPFDKMVCGLIDLQMFGDCPDAIPLLTKIAGWASRTFSRENIPARARPDGIYQGRPSEWYTLSENLFRAYEQTGDPKFREFANAWLYNTYWNKFSDTAAPPDAHGVHAYSHTNSFSSAAMAYAVTRDPIYLRIIRNAYDYMQKFQCYATGGFGPAETFIAPNGGLGKALEGRYNTSDAALFVNLYVPSEVTWRHSGGDVKLVQETRYPEAERVSLTLQMKTNVTFALKCRVPGWAKGMSIRVNGIASGITCNPGTWASMEREWTPGDRVEITIPLRFRMEAVDTQHPNRVAVVRGPVVYVIEADYHEPLFRLPELDADLDKWLAPDKTPGLYRVELPDRGRVVSKFHPFYEVGEGFPYKMYFDRDQLPVSLW